MPLNVRCSGKERGISAVVNQISSRSRRSRFRKEATRDSSACGEQKDPLIVRDRRMPERCPKTWGMEIPSIVCRLAEHDMVRNWTLRKKEKCWRN